MNKEDFEIFIRWCLKHKYMIPTKDRKNGDLIMYLDNTNFCRYSANVSGSGNNHYDEKTGKIVDTDNFWNVPADGIVKAFIIKRMELSETEKLLDKFMECYRYLQRLKNSDITWPLFKDIGTYDEFGKRFTNGIIPEEFMIWRGQHV